MIQPVAHDFAATLLWPENYGKENRPQSYPYPRETLRAPLAVLFPAFCTSDGVISHTRSGGRSAIALFRSLRCLFPHRWKSQAMTEYEIHPAIGIARVGSSRVGTNEGYFIGPEPGVSPPSHYRDSAGDLKRQAARFRVFTCERDEKGMLLAAEELTIAAVKTITWTVHLANRKGVARRQYGTRPGFRNNAKGVDELDRALIIDPGPRSVSYPGERQLFESGRFRTTNVPLGEMTMDRDGRLVVCPPSDNSCRSIGGNVWSNSRLLPVAAKPRIGGVNVGRIESMVARATKPGSGRLNSRLQCSPRNCGTSRISRPSNRYPNWRRKLHRRVGQTRQIR